MKQLKYLFLALSVAVLCSCGSGKKENNTMEKENWKWEKVNPTDLDFNPFQTIGVDWMALAMGGEKSMNSMTISWGTAGELWNKQVFTVFVSSDRYSKRLMDESKYFTVMAFPKSRKIKESLVYIGSRSQRDEPDKTVNAGFTVEYTELGNPIFKEANLVFECRIIYKEEFKMELLQPEVRRMYEDMGLHTMYIGEIVNVFVKQTVEEK